MLFEMVNDTPLFPAKDDNELLEYFIVTLGDIPLELFNLGNHFKEFYHWIKRKNEWSFKRSLKSAFGSETLKPGFQTLDILLKDKCEPALIDLLKRCLEYDPK